jgi:hypothetical protein
MLEILSQEFRYHPLKLLLMKSMGWVFIAMDNIEPLSTSKVITLDDTTFYIL